MKAPMDELMDSIRKVQAANANTGWVAVDAVTAAAEVFHMMMTSGVTIEWCRRHVRPYETCGLFLDDDCDPHVHVIGPKVIETT